MVDFTLCGMETADLIFRIIAAAGSIATFCALARLLYGDYFNRPILKLRFDPGRDQRDQFITPAWKEGQYWERSRWVRICVVN
jgi:hypothetical protein